MSGRYSMDPQVESSLCCWSRILWTFFLLLFFFLLHVVIVNWLAFWFAVKLLVLWLERWDAGVCVTKKVTIMTNLRFKLIGDLQLDTVISFIAGDVTWLLLSQDAIVCFSEFWHKAREINSGHFAMSREIPQLNYRSGKGLSLEPSCRHVCCRWIFCCFVLFFTCWSGIGLSQEPFCRPIHSPSFTSTSSCFTSDQSSIFPSTWSTSDITNHPH